MKQGSETALRLCWLGHPQVELSGSQVRLETRKTTALLAYLSLNQYPQSREKLAALLWPEFDQTRAPANLRRTLASLHASAAGKWLEAERNTVGLAPDSGLWIDVVAIRQLLAAIKTHPHEPEEPCPECLASAQEAIPLFRGEFLEGFNLPDSPEFDEWQMEQRESLRMELGLLLERSALAYAAVEQWEGALCSVRRWLSLDRLHEPALALLMRILALSGQRVAAIRQYEEYAEALNDEFGQVPDETTRELYNRIMSRQIAPAMKTLVAAKSAPSRAAGEPAETDSGPEAVRGLLRTKLSVPPVRDGVVRRERLTALLERGIACGLVVVSAPAGFGKTTILAELAAQVKAPVAWLSVDEGDNDPQRFLLHLAAALGAADRGLAERAAQMLGAMPPAPVELVMTDLINGIQALGTGTLLVLDDYQLIRTSQIHTALQFLIEHRPPLLTIFVASRADPPIPLARLRSQERVAELRADDLRFTEAEAERFFDCTMSMSLRKEQIEVLERRTEGWAAGLQMAALSLQGREDADGFIASFGGTHRYIMDYLAEEVLSRQSEELNAFLLDTSILSRMSAGLCEAVTGRRGGEGILRHLELMNLFLIPLDEERSWYRYHRLFADLLRHKLARERPQEQIRELHVKAGDWFAREGDPAEAVQEYLTAAEYGRAADLIEARYFEIISRGALDQLRCWCSAIPSELRERRPAFCAAAAWAMTWAGQRKEAEAELDRVERALRAEGAAGSPPGRLPDGFRALRGGVSANRALLADMAGETERSVELACAAQTLLAPEDIVSKTLVLYIIEKSHYYRGELEEAEQGCQELLRLSHATGSIFSVCAAVCELARLRSLQGRRRDGLTLLEEFDDLAARRRARDSGPIAKAYAILAEFKRERGDLAEALRIAEKAARDVDAWGLPSDVYITHQYFARVLRSCGQFDRALEEIAKVESLPDRMLVWRMLVPSFETDRVKIHLARGDVAAAEGWIPRYNPVNASEPVNRELELVCLARIRVTAGLRAGNADETIDLLDGLARCARAGKRIGSLIGILLLQARALASLSAQADAFDALDEALRLAQPEEYLRIFVEEGPQIAVLLQRGRDAGRWDTSPLDEYVLKLLSAFAASKQPRSPHGSAGHSKST